MMDWKVNMITVLIAGIFLIPVLLGMLRPFSGNRIQHSLVSMLKILKFMVAVLITLFLSKLLFSGEDGLFTNLLKNIPSIWDSISNQDVWAYLIADLIILTAISGLLTLLTIPLYKHITTCSNWISKEVSTMNSALKQVIGGLWQLPKSVVVVLFVTLLLNFYSGFAVNGAIGAQINHSAAYQFVNTTFLEPVMGSAAVKKIPIIMSNSLKNAIANLSAEGRMHFLVYFNGVTIDEAVISNSEIDETALNIIGDETDDKEKAYLIYEWICANIDYDYEKAASIDEDSSSVVSGASIAYATKTGVCFDFACLYVAMCRAADLQVRFISGLGYDGATWGDHAWNQVYDPGEERWIDVDTTFGSNGRNYFDREDFSLNHTDGEVQGEW